MNNIEPGGLKASRAGNSFSQSHAANVLPEGFVLYTEWPEYREFDASSRFIIREYIGTNPRGFRRGIKSFTVQSFVSDFEPGRRDYELSNVVFWQRLLRRDVPDDWKVSTLLSSFLEKKYDYAEGFARLGPGEEHFKRWSQAERPRRRKWLKELIDKKYFLRSAEFEDFWLAYTKSPTWNKIERSYKPWLRQMLLRDSQGLRNIHMRVIKDRDGNVIAGMATLDSVTHRGSYYLIGYLYESGRADHVMTGLMNEWFERAQEKGFTNVQFGQFWSAGSPDNWKGFSDFKAKFGTEFIYFPPMLVRFPKRERHST